MWAMARSPYDITMYIDADCQVVHDDLAKVWDHMYDDADMIFSELTEDRDYVFKDRHFKGGVMTLCGGVCLYDSSKPIIREFMQDWYDYYDNQRKGLWWPGDATEYPLGLAVWDQFTLWWLTEKCDKYQSLDIRIFEDDARWNYFMAYEDDRGHSIDEPVIQHYSCFAPKEAAIVAL